MGSSASKVSKTAVKTAAETTRRYPTTPTPRPTQPQKPTPPPGPTVHPETKASSTRNATINRDASDPNLALQERMRKLGPVQPNPTLSNSSKVYHAFRPREHPPHDREPRFKRILLDKNLDQKTQPETQSQFRASPSSPLQTIFPDEEKNPAVILLEARKRIIEEAEKEVEDVERMGFGRKGRRFLDVGLVRRALVLRDRAGWEPERIERELGLDRGVMGAFGRKGVFGVEDDV